MATKKSIWSEKLDEAGLTSKQQQEESSSSSRIDALEQDVTRLLSILTLQSEQLSRQEIIINELRDEKRAKENRTLYVVLLLLLAFIAVLLFVGIPSSDTVIQMNALTTPVKAPFITAAVRVKFTVGDVMESMKEAMARPSSSTALVVRR